MVLLVLFLLLAGIIIEPAAGCNKHIAVAVDVSGSVSIDPVTGRPRPGPEEIRSALKKTMQQYLFRDAGACVGIYRFATNASLVFDYAPVALEDTRRRLLAAVDTLPFEMAYPWYYTNWEAAIQIVYDAPLRPKWLYLVTDSSPTYSAEGKDHAPVDVNVRAAVGVSKRLQSAGTGVVGVGMGPDVKDVHLAAISGPCGAMGCFKGWNYFHVDSMAKASIPLGQSIQDRFLSVPALDEQAVVKRDSASAAKGTDTKIAVVAHAATVATTTTTPGTRQEFVTYAPFARLHHNHPIKGNAPIITREQIGRYNELSGGAVAGIVIGCIIGFCLVAFVFWFVVRWWLGEAPLSPSPKDAMSFPQKPYNVNRLPPPVVRL